MDEKTIFFFNLLIVEKWCFEIYQNQADENLLISILRNLPLKREIKCSFVCVCSDFISILCVVFSLMKKKKKKEKSTAVNERKTCDKSRSQIILAFVILNSSFIRVFRIRMFCV